MHEFLCNRQKLEMGVRQGGEKVGDVKLPNWVPQDKVFRILLFCKLFDNKLKKNKQIKWRLKQHYCVRSNVCYSSTEKKVEMVNHSEEQSFINTLTNFSEVTLFLRSMVAANRQRISILDMHICGYKQSKNARTHRPCVV